VHLPETFFFSEQTVVTQNPGPQTLWQDKRYGTAAVNTTISGIVAGARYLILYTSRSVLLDNHLILREHAGFVRTDHGG
jgi:hypothetical protein